MTFDSVAALSDRFVHSAPVAGGVVLVLLGGWAASALARRVVTSVTRRSGLEAAAERAGVAKLLYAVGIHQGPARLLGTLAYLAGAILTLSAASDLAGLTVLRTATDSVLRYMPRAVTAGALLIATVVVASMVRALVERAAARNGQVRSPRTAAAAVYTMVLVTGTMLAAEQAGIAVALLGTLLQIGVGVCGLGLALTFALGFHSVFRSMAVQHYYKPLLVIGDRVRIGEDEGVVVRMAPTAVILQTATGLRIVPSARLLHTTVEVHTGGAGVASRDGVDGPARAPDA